MTKTPRQVLENLTDNKEAIDKAIIAIDAYYFDLKDTPQYILSQVEIDKDWVKDLLLRSGLVTDVGAERIAEGIKAYSPIKLVEKK